MGPKGSDEVLPKVPAMYINSGFPWCTSSTTAWSQPICHRHIDTPKREGKKCFFHSLFSLSTVFSVVEKADSRECHSDIVLIAGLDDIVITYGAACLGDIAYAALMCALDIVTEGEEGI